MPAVYDPIPRPSIMYPSCETVEYAMTRFMSFLTSAIVAAISAVKPPMYATTSIADSLWTKMSYVRATRYTPAATIVAAWISAETGVGPSIASGNHTCSGNCALFPTAPIKTSTTAIVKSDPPINPAWAASEIPSKDVVPVLAQKMMIATNSAASPILVTMNAFRAASLAEGFSYQCPIRMYEHRPTSSQNTYNSMKFGETTSPSIEAVKRLRTA